MAKHKKRQKHELTATNATCPKCHRETQPEPVRGLEAAEHREMMRLAGIARGDLIAYCWCCSTVLLSEDSAKLVCQCDLDNWNKAGREYTERGAKACWDSLGVTDEMMAFAESKRIEELKAEKRTATGSSASN
jgi:hypothetical protein